MGNVLYDAAGTEDVNNINKKTASKNAVFLFYTYTVFKLVSYLFHYKNHLLFPIPFVIS